MKYILISLQVLVVVLIGAVIAATTVGSKTSINHNVPKLDDQLMPARRVPLDTRCDRPLSWESEYLNCMFSDDVLLVVRNSKIEITYLFLYDVEVNVGQLIDEWGAPTGAEYYTAGKSVSLYWPDRFAFLLVDKQFAPFSRLLFIGYGTTANENSGRWRGFVTMNMAQ